MKQVVQNMRSGQLSLMDVPAPALSSGQVLVSTQASLISAGTERMVMEFGKKSLLSKARERPDLVKKVIDKIARDGVADALSAAFSKLEEPLPLGYSAAGEVIAVAKDVHEFKAGDRVAIAGAGYANHAEVNAVPKNLVVAIPTGVAYQHACFATLTAIAMQGVRAAKLQLGDRVLVIGLGLVGQLVGQLLRANGCKVMALEYDAERRNIAAECSLLENYSPSDSQLEQHIRSFTNNRGFDAVLICAATDSDEPLNTAATYARDRARVVLVGKVGTTVPYAAFMKKELTFLISRSYGPGRYDAQFEEKGHNYPVGYVPWTERDNLQEAVRLMSTGQLNIAPLISHTFPIHEAEDAYAMVFERTVPSLGVVLHYPAAVQERLVPKLTLHSVQPVTGQIGLACIGAGGFTKGTLLPKLAGNTGVKLTGITSRGGLSARAAADKFGFAYVAANAEQILTDPETHAVLITTRHDSHAEYVCAALNAGKHVFVEKPLALTLADLERVEKAWRQSGKVLFVGFNRRFAPFTRDIAGAFASVQSARQVNIRVNAGRVESGSWVADPTSGGGRLLGEGCHFIDLACVLANSAVRRISATNGLGQDVFTLTLHFMNGGIANIFYTSEGAAAAGKEWVEVHASGLSARIENFRTATLFKGSNTQKLHKLWAPFLGADKGHKAELEYFISAVNGTALNSSNSLTESMIHSSRVTLLAAQALSDNNPIDIP